MFEFISEFQMLLADALHLRYTFPNLASERNAMKILISADMEGITGVVDWTQTDSSHPEYARFRKLMTLDVGAAAAGAFAGGADEVVVTDAHGDGLNILLEELDPHVRINCGLASPCSMVEGIAAGDVDGVFFVGYHGRAGSLNAVLAHTWSSGRIYNVWLNDALVGEFGLNAALAGHYGTPVLMVTGDQTACAQTVDLLGSMETVIVKKATGFQSAECLHPDVTGPMIQAAAERAVKLRKESTPKSFVVAAPVRVTIEFSQPVHADRAGRMPGMKRLDGRRIEFVVPDMPTAHAAFRSAVRISAD
jgi:D-amino peptidase